MLIYNARYPDNYDRPHFIFDKFKFDHELDTSTRREGLPGLCNVPGTIWPVAPCKISNVVVPIRNCNHIGYGEFGVWPRVKYSWWSWNSITSVEKLTAMYGSAFVSCRNDKLKHTPIVPNMDIMQGYDSISKSACLKFNFDGTVSPIWLGRPEEDVDTYLERLPARG